MAKKKDEASIKKRRGKQSPQKHPQRASGLKFQQNLKELVCDESSTDEYDNDTSTDSEKQETLLQDSLYHIEATLCSLLIRITIGYCTLMFYNKKLIILLIKVFLLFPLFFCFTHCYSLALNEKLGYWSKYRDSGLNTMAVENC